MESKWSQVFVIFFHKKSIKTWVESKPESVESRRSHFLTPTQTPGSPRKYEVESRKNMIVIRKEKRTGKR
jgi:hypothetical protein